MRSLLDEIVDTHHSGTGSNIVSEQHDSSKINWVGGVTDPGEMIGCGRYQQLRRLDGEADGAYQDRLTALLPTLPTDDRQRIETAMIAAANRRAGLDDTTGKVALYVAGDPAWHRLGVNVREAVNSFEARRLASLDWLVKKVPLSYQNPITNAICEAPGQFGIVRTDTGSMLGAVGSKYKPFQNEDGFAMLDSILGRFGARYESAGSLYGGKRVFMLVRLPKQCFTIGHRDHVDAFALFTNPHDGSGVGECFGTSDRAVCHNTLRIARSRKDKSGVELRHTGNLAARVAEAQQALHITATAFGQFAEHAQTFARTPMADVKHFANDVLDAVLEVTAAEALKGADALAAVLQATEAERALAAKTIDKKIERRGEILNDILERYESERCGLNGQRGTVWAGLNAITESADHGKLGGRFVGSEQSKASRRFESILTGDADEAKQAAYSRALALAT